MVNLANPMMDAEMDEQTRRYVGVLERQNIGLTVTVNKLKALTEVLAGAPHEEVLKDMEHKEVLDLVKQVELIRDPSLSDSEARQIASDKVAAQPTPDGA